MPRTPNTNQGLRSRTSNAVTGNHMISSAVWDESAQVSFSKVDQIVINFVVFEKFTTAYLSQIVRE